ncbi:MAG: glutamine-hydrolyzing carbamoyl-phosphate synthase small subunit [Desulfovibrionaceae bacterium]
MKALLVLEDGFTLEGRSFTGDCEGGGEAIFNTGMTGYQEILTDPSYAGQMVCMTYPLIGNYGINPEDMESGHVHAAALLVKECCKVPSNWRSTLSLPDFLCEHNVPGIEGLDTRALTRHLRVHGAMRGVVSTRTRDVAALVAQAQAIPSMEGQNLVTRVAPTSPYCWRDDAPKPVQLDAKGGHAWAGTGPRLVVYDFGIKWNILRLLAAQGFDMLVVPPTFSATQVKLCGAQAVFLSNGPGDPATLKDEIATITQLIDDYPTAGICLGHQLLGHAVGGTTTKLKFGHHGCNNPVQDLTTGKVEISSQNHGFCVVLDKVPRVEITHVNLNDGTLEGFAHKDRPVLAVQHHPEASPGPIDSQYFFARFRQLVQTHVGA